MSAGILVWQCRPEDRHTEFRIFQRRMQKSVFWYSKRHGSTGMLADMKGEVELFRPLRLTPRMDGSSRAFLFFSLWIRAHTTGWPPQID